MPTRWAAICALALTLTGCAPPAQAPESLRGATRGQETASPATPTPTTCEAPCTTPHTSSTPRVASSAASAPAPTASTPTRTPASARTAPAKAAPPAYSYSREQFGSGWADPDHNGCDARQDAVKKATTNRVYDGKCRIITADVYDRYSGRTYKAAKTSSFDIDHVVSLHDAWQSGANKWTRAKRVAYANDPSVLVLTTASLNRSKSDQGPDTWAPLPCAPVSSTCEPRCRSNGACWYVTQYRNIKRVWALHTTPGQRAAIKRTLTTC